MPLRRAFVFFVSHGRAFVPLFVLPGVRDSHPNADSPRIAGLSRNCHSRPLAVVTGLPNPFRGSGWENMSYVFPPASAHPLDVHWCYIPGCMCSPALQLQQDKCAVCLGHISIAAPARRSICGSTICGPGGFVEHTAWHITALVPGWKYSYLAALNHHVASAQ